MRKRPLNAQGQWAIDSGGFSELNLNGKWTVSEKQYVQELNRLTTNRGLLWAAQQDWMCEPWILEKTGLSVQEHQRKTVRNFAKLRSMECNVHIIPVIQGFHPDEYEECVYLFNEMGFDLRNEPLVGIGSICRRQRTDEIGQLVKRISKMGISLHGFGVKKSGLQKYGKYLASADSLAWSYEARYSKRRCLDTKHHPTSKACNNCLTYALEWRERLLNSLSLDANVPNLQLLPGLGHGGETHPDALS